MTVPYIVNSQNTGSLVTTGLLRAWSNASAAFNMASEAINAIETFVPEIEVDTNIHINDVSAPTLSDLTARRPERPADVEPVFPALPGEPNFIPIDYGAIPDFPDVDMNQVAVPEEVINTSIERYSSPLLAELKAKLLDRIVNGGTGLSPAIETAIWNRDQERALLALEASKTKAADEWSKRGWTLPNGILMESINNLETEYLNKRLEVSRDISIKQAELEQTNINTAIQFGVTLEGQLMAHHNQFCELMLRATESLQKAKVDIYTAWTAFYKSYVESIKNYSEAIADEARTKVEINKDLLGRYGVTIEAYKVRIQAEVERIGVLLKIYAEDIAAYGAEASAISAISGVKIEELRARIQESLGKANVEVETARANIQLAIAGAQVQVQALIAAGQTAAQLAAGAMAGAHVQAGVSSSFGEGNSASNSDSTTHND